MRLESTAREKTVTLYEMAPWLVPRAERAELEASQRKAARRRRRDMLGSIYAREKPDGTQ